MIDHLKKDNMPKKCLLACADEILLGSIVEDLISRGDELSCTGIIGKSTSELMAAIEKIQPDVLVMCHKTHNTLPVRFLDILARYPGMRIITVSTDDNYMHIYGKQKVLMRNSSDLLSIIQNV
jgi:chemotaxis response regulator CheB